MAGPAWRRALKTLHDNKVAKIVLVAVFCIAIGVLPVLFDLWLAPKDSQGHGLRCIRSHDEYFYPPASHVVVCDAYASPSPG